MKKESRRSLLITLFILDLFILLLPEMMTLTTYLIPLDLTVLTSHKLAISTGITRDFQALRSLQMSTTINPFSPILFFGALIALPILGTTLIINFKK